MSEEVGLIRGGPLDFWGMLKDFEQTIIWIHSFMQEKFIQQMYENVVQSLNFMLLFAGTEEQYWK